MNHTDLEDPKCPACDSAWLPQAAQCAHCGFAATQVEGIDALLQRESVLSDAEPSHSEPHQEVFDNVPDSEALLPEVLDDSENVQCLRCTALLPSYARYCLHCGAQQDVGLPESEEMNLDNEPLAQAPLVAPEAVVSQVSPPLSEPPPAEPSFLQSLRAQQLRVAQNLAPLESNRHWWKKYF